MSKILYEAGAAYEDGDEALIGYVDHLQGAALSASSEQTGGEVENIADGLTFDFWRSNATGSQTISIDFGAVRSVDYLALGAHNLDAELSGDIVLEYSNNGADYSTAYTLAQAAITDGGAVLVHLITRTHRYWRLTIPVSSTDLRLGVVQLGSLLQMQRTVYEGVNPPSLSRDEAMIPNTSEGGQFLGSFIAREFYVSSIQWEDLEPDWYRTFFEPFVITSQTRPFFIAWRPSEFDTEVVFAHRRGSIRPSNSGTEGLMSVSLDIQAVA